MIPRRHLPSTPLPLHENGFRVNDSGFGGTSCTVATYTRQRNSALHFHGFGKFIHTSGIEYPLPHIWPHASLVKPCFMQDSEERVIDA